LARAVAYAREARFAGTCGPVEMAKGATLADAIRRPELEAADLAPLWPAEVSSDIGTRAVIELKLEGYVQRQLVAIDRAQRADGDPIPEDFRYAAIDSLSREAREKLERHRPRTLGAAARVPGVTPADAAILALFVHRARAAAAP
jgi:tRNA uridine 5-carboxymethylaminomethyl modification enzyme